MRGGLWEARIGRGTTPSPGILAVRSGSPFTSPPCSGARCSGPSSEPGSDCLLAGEGATARLAYCHLVGSWMQPLRKTCSCWGPTIRPTGARTTAEWSPRLVTPVRRERREELALAQRQLSGPDPGAVPRRIVILGLLYAAMAGFAFLLDPRDFRLPRNLGWSIPVFGFAVVVPYLSVSWWTTGRTYGKALLEHHVHRLRTRGPGADPVRMSHALKLHACSLK